MVPDEADLSVSSPYHTRQQVSYVELCRRYLLPAYANINIVYPCARISPRSTCSTPCVLSGIGLSTSTLTVVEGRYHLTNVKIKGLLNGTRNSHGLQSVTGAASARSARSTYWQHACPPMECYASALARSNCSKQCVYCPPATTP